MLSASDLRARVTLVKRMCGRWEAARGGFTRLPDAHPGLRIETWGTQSRGDFCRPTRSEAIGYMLPPRLAGGMMLFMRRYSTIWP